MSQQTYYLDNESFDSYLIDCANNQNKEPNLRNKKQLKICLLSYRSNPFSGGQGVYIKYLSQALTDLGHQVDVISGPPYPSLDSRVRLIKLPSLNLYEAKNKFTAFRPSILKSYTNLYEWLSINTGGFAEPYTFGRRAVKYLKTHGMHYDVIHDNQSLSYGLLSLQKLGLPLLSTIHHPITQDLSIALKQTNDWFLKILIKRWHSFLKMQKKVVKRLQHITTVSECSRDMIATDFKIPSESMHLVPCGIDTGQFKPLHSTLRKPYTIMATASADAPLKGLDYLLYAVAELRSRYPKLRLTVVGKPRPNGHTERLIKKLNIKEIVNFHSGVSADRITELYAQATLAVVPSLYEGFGLPAGEAMACGVPLISTTGGALPEVVGEAGLLIPPADHKALIDAINKLLTNKPLREKLGQAGRERIVNNFSWQVTARKLTNYYYQVIAGANS